ncbi:EamA family transporter [Carboxydothermus islandicus]|uniref:EamA family transporter n=1 Tax=Carboxydothermus islandicus TaxID=661089 RepID=UPI00098246F3
MTGRRRILPAVQSRFLPLVFLTKYILLLLAITFINVLGQFFIKKGVSGQELSLTSLTGIKYFLTLFLQPYVIFGFLFYAVSSILWMFVLSKVDLSLAYPILSFGYVLVLAISKYFLHEAVSLQRWVGALLICGGIVLLAGKG